MPSEYCHNELNTFLSEFTLQAESIFLMNCKIMVVTGILLFNDENLLIKTKLQQFSNNKKNFRSLKLQKALNPLEAPHQTHFIMLWLTE